MTTVPLEAGDPRRLGRFELTGRLGEGGQGVVYLGRSPDGVPVAVKVLRTSANPKALERLGRELEAIHKVQPFVTAQVIETGVEGSRRYVVSEYIAGPTLHRRVVEGGPLRAGELQRLAVGTATALTAIHGAGVVHRDLKPANVLLGPDGPRVVDFGIARLIDAGTTTSQLVGTPAYLAPEQLRGESPTTAVDVFSWAVTIGFAATGRTPFGSDSVPAVMNRILYAEPDLSGVPALLRDMLASCLAKDPRHRPTARDLLVRLVDPSAAAPAEPPPTRPTVPVRLRNRGRGAAVAGGALALLLLVGLGGWALFGREHRPAGRTPPSSAAGGPSVPASLGGTWTGRLTQSASALQGEKTTDARIILTAGRRHGTSSYTDWGCTDTLALTEVSGAALTFTETSHGNPQCIGGTVTLTRTGAGLAYRSSPAPLGEVTTGILHHTR